jgi:hypothetical protein
MKDERFSYAAAYGSLHINMRFIASDLKIECIRDGVDLPEEAVMLLEKLSKEAVDKSRQAGSQWEHLSEGTKQAASNSKW